MTDFYEIDFHPVGTGKSGDAISLRYQIGESQYIHVVDGGYQYTGEELVKNINKFYENPTFINHVVVTHNDGDHAGGLRSVLDEFDVGALWMLRPWLYAADLIDDFKRFTSIENLEKRLREVFPNLAALEELALTKGIPIYEPLQGATIGAFTVMAPSKSLFLDLILESDKTPDTHEPEEKAISEKDFSIFQKVVNFVRAKWGEESFSRDETSTENEMSVVQGAVLCEKKILLTGDAGRRSLKEVVDYAPSAGMPLPGINLFQVPHHGSRKNVTTEILDSLLGTRLLFKPEKELFTAVTSAAKDDDDHPRKSVERAMIHRGGKHITTKDGGKRSYLNAPNREGWVTVEGTPYPEDQEED